MPCVCAEKPELLLSRLWADAAGEQLDQIKTCRLSLYRIKAIPVSPSDKHRLKEKQIPCFANN